MNRLPDELLTDILDYVDPHDVVATQGVSRRLVKLARDPTLWRYKCFEKAPSATQSLASRPHALSALTGALGGLSLDGTANQPAGQQPQPPASTRASARAKAVTEWDRSDASEHIDWYSEYIARHAPLSMEWTSQPASAEVELRGMCLYRAGESVVTPTSDGSLLIWNLTSAINGRPKLIPAGSSRSGLLFENRSSVGQSSKSTKKSLGNAVDNISIDDKQHRAYIATESCLNEVDLERMEVISQQEYAWPITALSQDQSQNDYQLTVGTSWSLHIHDSRLPSVTSTTNGEIVDKTSQVESPTTPSNIAFLPNYTKLKSLRETGAIPEPPLSEPDYFDIAPRGNLKAFARVEPGPQSILHHGENEIVIAGRMPSILFYDRRYFPRLQSAIHSGARLSAMAILPFKPTLASNLSSSSEGSTLIACGEYGGCGSLEIYQLPHQGQQQNRANESPVVGDLSNLARQDPSPVVIDGDRPFSYKNRQQASSSKLLAVATQGTRIVFADAEGQLKWVERDGRGLARRWNINSYSVTATSDSFASSFNSNRITTSNTIDISARGLGRYNSNAIASAGVTGEQVVRKMIALPSLYNSSTSFQNYYTPSSSARDHCDSNSLGTRTAMTTGDSDILIWTGERVGIVTTKPFLKGYDDTMDNTSDDLVAAFQRGMHIDSMSSSDFDSDNDDTDNEAKSQREQEQEYAQVMRRALERQADERRWMSRFGGRAR